MKNQKGISTRHNPSVRIKNTTAGITLIALVITIIVLLILAGVSISMVIGNNGILNQASTAGVETKKASEQEQIELAFLAAKTKKLANPEKGTKVSASELEDELEANGVTNVASVSEDAEIITVKFNSGNVYTVENEVVTLDGEASGTPGGGTSLASQITSVNYGDKINYIGNGINDWQIFYKDNNDNVFIIATEYVELSKIDTEKTKMVAGNYMPRSVYWGSDVTLQTVNSVALNLFRVGETGYTLKSDLMGSKKASTLLNTENWTNFVDTTKAKYAMGGPTLEMWVKSWNQKYNDSLTYGIDENGYTSEGLTFESKSGYLEAVSNENNTGYGNMYFPHPNTSYTEAQGYHFAAPCQYQGVNVVTVLSYYRIVGHDSTNYGNFGIRPVVLLNSNVSAIKSGDIWELGN